MTGSLVSGHLFVYPVQIYYCTELLLVLELHVLYVNGLLNLLSLLYRWFHKILSGTELTDSTCFLKFSLESFERSLDVLTLFKRYNNHI